MPSFDISNLKVSPTRSADPTGLGALDLVTLSGERHILFEAAKEDLAGHAAWRNRKLAEAHDLLALSEVARRFNVALIDLRESIRALVSVEVPVPLRPEASGELRIAPAAALGIVYPEQAIREPLPGTAFVQVLEPKDIWHANVSDGRVQVLCLGAQLPAGIPLKEIVLSCYGALSMQTVMIDEQDTAGVLNTAAAKWWQQNIHLTPLTRAGFLEQDPSEDA